jgi:hypothetical protein
VEELMADTKLLELPYEKIAMAGGEMPDNLSSADQQMFLELRLLYDSHKRGIIDREAARREKAKLLDEYKANLLMDVFCKQWAQQHTKTEQARQTYRKNRTLKNADAVILAFEGVPVTIYEEAL